MPSEALTETPCPRGQARRGASRAAAGAEGIPWAALPTRRRAGMGEAAARARLREHRGRKEKKLLFSSTKHAPALSSLQGTTSPRSQTCAASGRLHNSALPQTPVAVTKEIQGWAEEGTAWGPRTLSVQTDLRSWTGSLPLVAPVLSLGGSRLLPGPSPPHGAVTPSQGGGGTSEARGPGDRPTGCPQPLPDVCPLDIGLRRWQSPELDLGRGKGQPVPAAHSPATVMARSSGSSLKLGSSMGGGQGSDQRSRLGFRGPHPDSWPCSSQMGSSQTCFLHRWWGRAVFQKPPGHVHRPLLNKLKRPPDHPGPTPPLLPARGSLCQS